MYSFSVVVSVVGETAITYINHLIICYFDLSVLFTQHAMFSRAGGSQKEGHGDLATILAAGEGVATARYSCNRFVNNARLCAESS